MTFGFTNAPATFQGMINKVLSPFLRKFVVIYLDDILIYSSTREEHVQHIKAVLDTLRSNKLYAKLKKCEFLSKEVHYLGHIISPEGIRTDPDKVNSVTHWPVPKTIHDIRSFLGITNYYRCYIRNYADLARPLQEIVRKDQPFEWTTPRQETFEALKKCVTSAPMLRHSTLINQHALKRTPLPMPGGQCYLNASVRTGIL
jgi:Reverse transcriptase (RNA-dependent DNA polymerase)